MGRKHRAKKMSDKQAEENLTAKLVETGYREELKKKVREDHQMINKLSQSLLSN